MFAVFCPLGRGERHTQAVSVILWAAVSSVPKHRNFTFLLMFSKSSDLGNFPVSASPFFERRIIPGREGVKGSIKRETFLFYLFLGNIFKCLHRLDSSFTFWLLCSHHNEEGCIFSRAQSAATAKKKVSCLKFTSSSFHLHVFLFYHIKQVISFSSEFQP